MIRLAIRGLVQRPVRTTLTVLAIVLGVGLISGALTLGDTLLGAAKKLSASAYDGTDGVVVAKTAFKVDRENSHQAPTIPAATLQRVRAVPEVGTAVGDITDDARITGKDGKTVGSGPYFGVGLDAKTPGAQRLTPFRLEQGRWAAGPGQVVIDASTAKKEHYGVGDRVAVKTKGPAKPFTVTGVATFGGVKSLGTATVALFDLDSAQALWGKTGAYDTVLFAGEPGTSPAAVRKAVAAALPPREAVQTAQAQDRFTLDGLESFVKILRTILLAFGGVAVFVGAFTIFNTLSITVAQRTRELGLARALGASRRQVLGSVALEALVIGALASVIGLFIGLALAKGLQGVFAAFDLDLPRTGTVFAGRTVIVALIVGITVTVLAGLGPALRATRIAPVAVLREGVEIPPGRIGRRAGAIAAAIGVLGLGLLGIGMFAGGIEAGGRFALMGPGCLLLFVAIALASPKLMPPLAGVLGRPAAIGAGTAGVLARRNAVRNPGRTAVTAAALMIGIALIAFVATFAHGIQDSFSGSAHRVLAADYVLSGQDGWSPIDPAAARAAAGTPGVRLTSSLTQDDARAFGKKITVDGVDQATIGQVYRFSWKKGSDASLRALGSGGAIVGKDFAKDHGLTVGSTVTLTSVSGRRVSAGVAGVEDPPRFNPLDLGEVTVGAATYAKAFPTIRPRFTLVGADDGTSAATQRALDRRLAGFPDVKVATAQRFIDDQAAWIDSILAILYVLLALSVIVSLFGIVNTLVLSVFERTRELGMLRAVGMSRRQVRRMIRRESVITALIGAVLGIAVGLALAGLVTVALAGEGLTYSVPVTSLVVFTLVAVLAGLLAAIGPARRAARLDVLRAITDE